MATGTTIPPMPATSGSATRRRSRNSPMSNSRRASSPMMKKKNVIRPLLSQSRRVSDTPAPPRRIDSGNRHTDSYDVTSMFAHASAIRVATSRMAALADSVRRKTRSGVWRLRVHAVRPAKGAAEASVIAELSAAEKCQHFGVEGSGVGYVQSVRSVGDEDEFAAVDGFGGAPAAGLERHDRVGIAVDHQGRDGEPW